MRRCLSALRSQGTAGSNNEPQHTPVGTAVPRGLRCGCKHGGQPSRGAAGGLLGSAQQTPHARAAEPDEVPAAPLSMSPKEARLWSAQSTRGLAAPVSITTKACRQPDLGRGVTDCLCVCPTG